MTLTQPQSKNSPSLLVVSGDSSSQPHPYPTPSPSWTLPSPSYLAENNKSAYSKLTPDPQSYFAALAPSPSSRAALATPQPSPSAATHSKIATIDPRPSYLISPGLEYNPYTSQGQQSSSSSISGGSVPAPWAPKPRTWNEDPLINKVQGAPRSPPETSLGSPIARMQSHVPPTQYLLPLMTATPSAEAYAAAPPTFGGGLGMAFPELLPVPSTTASNIVKQESTAEHDKPAVGPAEYADVSRDLHRRGRHDELTIPQALAAYKHIRRAIPYIRSADIAPTTPGQSYRSVLDCASNAISILLGLPPPRVRPPPQEPVPIKRARTTHNEKDKPATYCRGCGATETPEWRRGPLGPRTLCNACVSREYAMRY